MILLVGILLGVGLGLLYAEEVDTLLHWGR